MLARGVFSFHPPRLHASSCFPSKSFVSPTCKISFRNSFVSPTYAKTRGVGGISSQSSVLLFRLVRPFKQRMSARRHLLSLFSKSPLSTLLLFNHLRTLSFSVSYLSAVLPTSSALLRQKPGVHPLLLSLSPPFPGAPFPPMATLSARLPLTDRWPLRLTPLPATPSPREKLRGIAAASPLSPFARSLTQKQGGTGYWSYQLSSLSAVDCRLLVSPSYSPPCPTCPFPLQ